MSRYYREMLENLKMNAPQITKGLYPKWTILMKKIKVAMYFWVREEEINDWFNNKNVFFILSIGRSGTKFLSSLLNKAPNALVVHEPFIESIPHQDVFNDPRKAEEYIQKFRKKEIYLRVRNYDIETYGEVNSFLRRHCQALKHGLPKATLIHLVRDGRAVVRSMYSRNTMLPNDYNTKRIRPREDDPWKDEWHKMSRFEKLCWYWAVENKYLRECIGKTVQFEKLVTDYDYFKKNLLKPLKLDIPEEMWKSEVNKPKNVTTTYKLPHWKEWDQKKKEAFERICGDEMKKCGYKLDW